MRWIVGWAALAAALLVPAAACAQRFIAITFEIGTTNDSATFVDLDRVERSGDLATALAFVEHMEPYRLPNGVGVARRYLRLQFDCRRNEIRMVLIDSMMDTVTPAQFAAAPAQAVPADSATAIGICNRPGALKPLWPLLNSEFREAPEKRKVLTNYAQTHPWSGMIDAKQSFIRIRATEMFSRLTEGVTFWPTPKPVPGLPAQGFVFTPLSWEYDDTGTGPARFSGGYVELPTVVELADKYYFYSVTTIASPFMLIQGIEPLYRDLGVEVRCGAKPVQRVMGMDFFHPSRNVESVAVPMASLKWHTPLFPFSSELCAKKFTPDAKRVATTKEAVADLVQTLGRQNAGQRNSGWR